MLSVKEQGILRCIINHCSNIEEDTFTMSQEEFDADRKTQNSVCFDILQIGELVKSLPDAFIDKYDEMPWKDIKGMRDWVAHGYQKINMSQVWNTATKEIQPLRIYCESLLKTSA